jgi:hypothetical protein
LRHWFDSLGMVETQEPEPLSAEPKAVF